MTDKKFTDEEIIKAFVSCASGGIELCKKCPYERFGRDCAERLHTDILDLINQQRAKIKALEMDNAQLHSDIINATQNLDHVTNLYEEEKTKVESAKQKVINIAKALKTARTEAIKEFAERVIDLIYDADDVTPLTEWQIRDLVKKLTRSCPDCKYFVGCEAACGGVPCDGYTEGDTNAE